MGSLTSSRPLMCPREKHCSEWARQYIKYCLCDVRDGVSLALGMVSVISWGVAEIPQIITNYRTKSTEGLSIAFLMTWIVGDMFNLFGCMLEPATLPTQFYMAILFTLTTLVLAGQTIYYGHIYHRLKFNRQNHKTGAVEKKISCSSGVSKKQDNNVDGWGNAINVFGSGVAQSSPIPLPAVPRSSSLEREVYYTSARSLSRSHTPTSVSFLAQRLTLTTLSRQNTLEEPLLGGIASTPPAPPSNNKTMLCAFSAVTFFLGTLNLHLTESNGLHMVSGKPYKGVVMRVGRKLLQVSGGFLEETGGAGSSRIGTLLGCGMAAIYMGGRLPQICLNIRRGHLEGVSPLMFIFALVGNITYVARWYNGTLVQGHEVLENSPLYNKDDMAIDIHIFNGILVSSLDWSKLSANLPWLVDAGGCAVLDTFILIQFIYYRRRALQDDDVTIKNSNHT